MIRVVFCHLFFIQQNKMAVEDRRIPTRTVVNTDNTTIQLFIEYLPDDSINLSFFVSLVDQITGGMRFVAGDLGYIYQGISDLFAINDAGDFIVNAVAPERYSINDAGDLIYTT